LHIDGDFLDEFADFNDLERTGFRVGGEFPFFRPGIGRVVVAYVTNQQALAGAVED
jgi:hypothetical protein